MRRAYVHGYARSESERLQDQAQTLEATIHAGLSYPPGAAVLEVGCGVGAQTVALAGNSPEALITSVDVSAASLAVAHARCAAAGRGNVRFHEADIAALPFADGSHDHAFVCFVLEHLPHPLAALAAVARVLRPGGTITLIEGDHGSAFFHPDDPAAHAAIACQVALQRRAGGDALIGRRLGCLLRAGGWSDVRTAARLVHADSDRPDLVDGFILKTFTPMIAGVRDAATAGGLIDAATFDAGIAALRRTAQDDGTFCYVFFKATACKA